MSKLLKAVNDQAKDLSNMELLNQLSAVLDKHREVSIQEATYRLLSMNMTKSTVVVKHISTIHPHFRDGLLRADLDSLEEGESIFHTSPHQYYENRSMKCRDDVKYTEAELKHGYWENLSLAEFWSLYDIVYGPNKQDKQGKLIYIPLENNKGCIKRRTDRCVLKYYLNFSNDEDLSRGLLILFHPFKNEMKDIHEENVMDLYDKNKQEIERKRNIFEKHKVITDIVSLLSKQQDEYEKDDPIEDEFLDIETTTEEELESFEKWAKSQAQVALNKHKELTTIVKLSNLREIIMQLNGQQRNIFDDFCERLLDEDDAPFYLYIGGEAGTGKSFLVKLMIEILKHIKTKSGDDLNKPTSIVMAPTANAAYLIKGKTIESALGMLPRQRNSYVKVNKSKLSNLTFLYDDVSTAFCDEISMVGSCKLTKMNFQLQDIRGDIRFMGGLNFIAVGDFRQLPPVLDSYVYENNHLDGRPAIAPSHWDENFQIFYLTEKMRSQKDPEFSEICDRIGNGTYTNNDLSYLRQCVRNTDSENHNENFKNGNVSYIVTTNKRRQEINEIKLETLLKNEKSFISVAADRCTNLENPPEVPGNMTVTQTGGLEQKLVIKINAPIVITSNHNLAKYKEDGIVNGARAYIDSIQVSKKDKDEVDVIWVVFKDKTVGRLLRYEYRNLKKSHKPKNEEAVPILKQKKCFTINRGEVRYQRTQFPLTLAYAITAHKCQGDTLEEVIIDFSHGIGERANIPWGSFYVALTRVKEGKNVFLKTFEKEQITFNVKVENKIASMRELKSYRFKKIYLSDKVFAEDDGEIKLSYFNIRGFLESNHAEYLDHDLNLLNSHYLVVSETWLNQETKNDEVTRRLKKWRIIKRLDATDNKKHMGLLLMAPNNNKNYKDALFNLDYVEGYSETNGDLLYQGIVVDLNYIYRRIVCMYIRRTPNKLEATNMAERFKDFDCIVGDLNLNPAIPEDKSKLLALCGIKKVMALNEITTVYNSQLEHVILEQTLSKNCFVTSFVNFGSDHKSVAVRFGKSKFTKEFLERRNFDSNHHLKYKPTLSSIDELAETYQTEVKKLKQKKKSDQHKQAPTRQSNRNKTISKNNEFLAMNKDLIMIRFSNPSRTNLCFSNAAVSSLLNVPILRKFLSEYNMHIDENPITEELVFLAKVNNLSEASSQKIREIVQCRCFQAGQLTKDFCNNHQHDSGEFIQSLLEHFWNENLQLANTLKEDMFGGVSQDTLSCACGYRVKLAHEDMSEIIPIPTGAESVQRGVEDFFCAENIAWKCPICAKQTVQKSRTIIIEPSTLILQLMRYKFDYVKNEASKIHDQILCSPYILMPSRSTYFLVFVINHNGEDTTSGHYNVMLSNKHSNKYVLLDDSNISYVADDYNGKSDVSYIYIL